MADRTARSLAGTLNFTTDVSGYMNAEVAPGYRSFKTRAEVEATDISDAGDGTMALIVWVENDHGEFSAPKSVFEKPVQRLLTRVAMAATVMRASATRVSCS